MTEQLLHDADVIPIFQQVRREAMRIVCGPTRFVIPAGRTAWTSAFCTTDSCRWYRDGGPNRGSRQIRPAGNTNCQRHSVAAFGNLLATRRARSRQPSVREMEEIA